MANFGKLIATLVVLAAVSGCVSSEQRAEINQARQFAVTVSPGMQRDEVETIARSIFGEEPERPTSFWGEYDGVWVEYQLPRNDNVLKNIRFDVMSVPDICMIRAGTCTPSNLPVILEQESDVNTYTIHGLGWGYLSPAIGRLVAFFDSDDALLGVANSLRVDYTAFFPR